MRFYNFIFSHRTRVCKLGVGTVEIETYTIILLHIGTYCVAELPNGKISLFEVLRYKK